MRYTTKDAVVRELLTYLTNLPEDFGWYKFDKDKTAQAIDFWMMRKEATFADDIKPVLQKSSAGYCFHRLDFDMEPGDTPLFDDFLAHFEDEGADAFMAFVGMLFDATAPRQQYLWMYGPGGDGKGTFLALLKKIFGRSYVAAVAGRHLAQDKFFTSRFIDARLGVFPDCHDPRFVQSEIFMMLTGGDAVPIEKKGKDVITMEIPTFFVVSSNDAPALTGSPAHRRRAVVCKLRERTTMCGDVLSYPDRLWEERAAILWKCWEAWHRHRKAHGRVQMCEETLRAVIDDSESYYEELCTKYFVIKPDIAGNTTLGKVADVLRSEERFNDIQIGQFKKYLQRKGVRVARMNDAKRKWYYHGLHLKTGTYGSTGDGSPSF